MLPVSLGLGGGIGTQNQNYLGLFWWRRELGQEASLSSVSSLHNCTNEFTFDVNLKAELIKKKRYQFIYQIFSVNEIQKSLEFQKGIKFKIESLMFLFLKKWRPDANKMKKKKWKTHTYRRRIRNTCVDHELRLHCSTPEVHRSKLYVLDQETSLFR